MAMIEVVAAIVDGNRLSTNLPEIDAIRLLGGRIEYISRHEAVDLADPAMIR